MQNLWDQFSMNPKWNNPYIWLIIRQPAQFHRNVTLLFTQLEHVRSSVPRFVHESFQNYGENHSTWRSWVEQAITELTQFLLFTIKDLNRLAQYINESLASVDQGFNNLAQTVYYTIPEAIS